jgi:NAD+ synthase (glutamine-hydrolysing)
MIGYIKQKTKDRLTVKIALAQLDVIPNKAEKNLERMLRMVDEAKVQSVDLIAFPEMCIGGYMLSDKWQDDGYCNNLMEYNEVLREASRGISIAYGNIYLDKSINKRVLGFHPNKDGRTRKYNSVYIFQDREYVSRLREINILPQGVQPKTLLPNYRIFDEERYFFSSQDIAKDFSLSLESLLQPFLLRVDQEQVPIGFELCEDLWCADYRRNGDALNPTKILIQNGARLIINISASPWTFGKNKTRDKRIEFLKKESGNDFVPFLYVNCVGAQNNGKNIVVFDGASTVYNSDGLPVILGDTYQEELIIVCESDFSKKPLERIEKGKAEEKFQAIIRGLRHINDILGHVPKYVIGLSGGIDSAVVASLLTITVGKENVIAVNMPTKYNKQVTKDIAKHVAEKLGIEYVIIPITELVELNRRLVMAKTNAEKLDSVLEQNIQAKVRMQILSNLAQKYGGIYTNNGNKWEIATGYCTLDGDARGALAPIGDLTKSEVILIAQYLNEHIFEVEVIPQASIRLEILPGAELEYQQINPLKLGYHCALIEAFMDYMPKSAEDIMKWYLDGTLEDNLGITTQLIRDHRIDHPGEFVRDLEWFNSQVQKSVFKRIQGQPIILLTKTAYGYDRRESILPEDITTPKYHKLRTQILSMESYKPANSLRKPVYF